jgi:hypothetical protein
LLCLQVGERGEVEQLDGIQVEAGLFTAMGTEVTPLILPFTAGWNPGRGGPFHSNGNRRDAINFTVYSWMGSR